MANYSLVANATFKPFSYQELTAPLDRQELYHERLAEEYDNLSKQADVLEIMGNNEMDKNSGSYSRYKSYSDALRKEADELFAHGLNSESRRRLTDLRRMYNTTIVPIQTAYSKREKEADEQMKATLQNPTIMFTRDASKTTLDSYISNPTGGYGVINGANITKQMADMAGHLAKQVRSGKKENIDAYTYNYIEKYGLDENLIRNWQDSPTLKKMFEQVMQANGVTPEALQGSMNADSIITKSQNYAEMGMWNAMGEDKSHIQEDFGRRLAARTTAEVNAHRQKKIIDQQFAQQQTGGNIAINPVNIYSNKDIKAADAAYNAYNKYFDKRPDGTYVLNEAGKKEYNKTTDMWVSAGGWGSYRKPTQSQFRKFIDSRKANGDTDPGAIWGSYVATQPTNQFDATRSTEFDYTIADSQQKDMKGAIQTAARGTALQEVDFDNKQNTFKATGETLKLEDLNSDKYTVLSTRFSPYGNTVMIKSDNGEVHRYQMPAGINPTNEQNRDRAMQKALKLQTAIATGKITDRSGREQALTPDELRAAQQQYRQALQEAYMYHSQLGVSNKTKEQEFNPYGY